MKALALFFLFVLPAPVFSQYVYVHPAHRVPNQTGVQCAWSSLETMARHHGYTQLYNVTSYQLGPSTLMQNRLEAQRAGVPYQVIRRPFTHSLMPLQRAISNGHPVAVAIRPNGFFGMKHMLIMNGIDRRAGTVSLIDNQGSMSPKTMSIWQFRRLYTGRAIYLR